jgi:hypothetical protein
MNWDDWLEKRKNEKQEEKLLQKQKILEAKLSQAQLKKISEEKQRKKKEAHLKKLEKEKWKKSKEEWRGEYIENRICSFCDKEGMIKKLKIIYTLWSPTHYAKSSCEYCGKFDRWIPHPKPYNEFK